MGTDGGGWEATAVNGWGMVHACAAEFPLDPISRYVLCTYAQSTPHQRPVRNLGCGAEKSEQWICRRHLQLANIRDVSTAADEDSVRWGG
jgi:hypothetical protein